MHRYIAAALVRHARLWLLLGLAGALAGLCAVVLPQPNEASTRLLLSHRPDDDATSAMTTDVGLATSRSVAERVITRLGLEDTPEELIERYSARAVSDRVLELTVAADTTAQATRQVREIGAVVLQYRLERARARSAPVQRQLTAARTRDEHLRDDGVPHERIAALAESVALENEALAEVGESRVLDRAAPVRASRWDEAVTGTGYGLVGGLAVGVAFVVLRTLFTGPLWQRQAIARALGAPVTASVGRVHRLPARLGGRSAAARRAADELRATVDDQGQAKPTLLVVPVDCTRSSALVVATLSVAYAREGRRVLVADVSRHRRLAKALDAGTGTAPSPLVPDGHLVVHVPGTGAPGHGPLEPDDRATSYDALRIESAVADLVLTFADVTAADRGDHLRSWAPRAVAMVSASWASASRLRTTAELLRLAGVELVCAVLLGAHRVDQLTVTSPREA